MSGGEKKHADVRIEKPILENAELDDLLQSGDSAPKSADAGKDSHPQTRHSKPSGRPATAASALMPQSERIQDILRQRAAKLAEEEEQADDIEEVPFIRIRLGAAETYGIPFSRLNEIYPAHNLCEIPCTPEFVLGVINWRGKLLSVLNVGAFFGKPAPGITQDTQIAIVHANGAEVGILVDSVESDDLYRPAELAPISGGEKDGNSNYVLGIHSGRVAILDIEALLGDKALLVGGHEAN